MITSYLSRVCLTQLSAKSQRRTVARSSYYERCAALRRHYWNEQIFSLPKDKYQHFYANRWLNVLHRLIKLSLLLCHPKNVPDSVRNTHQRDQASEQTSKNECSVQNISGFIEMQTQTTRNNNNHIIDYLLNGYHLLNDTININYSSTNQIRALLSHWIPSAQNELFYEQSHSVSVCAKCTK